MERRIALLSLFSVYSFSSIINHDLIDKDKSTIQIAVSTSKERLEEYSKKFKEYDLYIEKINNYTLYAVNIDNKKKSLEDIRKNSKDAFIIEKRFFFKDKALDKKIEEHSEAITNKSFNDAEYERALHYYREKDYEKAYALFSKLFLNKMDDTLVNYYLGRSAFETKRYEFAISAYDRILIKEPNNQRVRVELAQTYMQMNLLAQSIKEFETVLKGKIPLSVRKRVLSSIDFIKSKQQKHYFNATALISFMYDSNVNVAPDAGSFDIYSPIIDSIITLDTNNEKEGASILQLATVLSYKYKFDENYILSASVTPLMLKYKNYKEKDIHALSFDISPSYFGKDYKFQLGFLYDYIYLGHEKNQGNFYLNPKFTKILNSNSMLELGLKKGRMNYAIDDDRDADLQEMETRYRYIAEDLGIFSMSLIFGQEEERIDTRTDVSNSYYNLIFSNSFNFFNDYTLQTQFSYKDIQYNDIDVNFQTKREDKKRDYSLTLQKIITEDFIMSLGGTYTDINSNHEPFEYDKYTLKSNFIYSF